MRITTRAGAIFMDKPAAVNMGSVAVIAGCAFLAWSFSFVGNDAYKERDFLPLPITSESQIARQCMKYYKSYGYKLIRG